MAYSSVSRNGQSALRVTATVPVVEIGNDAYNNGLFVQGAGTSAAYTASLCDCTPYNFPNVLSVNGTASTSVSQAAGSWVSPHIPLLALAFDRYAMESLTFHYEPQSASTVADRMVFAWTDDPFHPFLSATGVAATEYDVVLPSQLQLLVTKDSVAFAPWAPWSLRVPVSRDDKYLFDQGESGQVNESIRFFSFGSMSCIGSAKPETAVLYGILYASVSVILHDPVPIIQSTKTIITLFHQIRTESKDSKKSSRLKARLLESPPPPPPPTPAATPVESKSVKVALLPSPSPSESDGKDLDESHRDKYILCEEYLPPTPKIPASAAAAAVPGAGYLTHATSSSSVPLSLRGLRK